MKSPTIKDTRMRSPAILVRLDPEMRDRLEQYREAQEVPPSLARIMHRALERFLEDMKAKGTDQ